MRAVEDFLRKNGVPCPPSAFERTVAQSVKDLFAVQAAQLWNHGELPEEEIPEDAEVAARLVKEPPNPPLDLAQLCALRAELRALVPGIHEVIDRCYMTSTSKAPDTAPTKTAEPPVTPADAMLEIPPPPPPHQKEGPAEPGAIVAETGVVHAVLPPQDIRHPASPVRSAPAEPPLTWSQTQPPSVGAV